MKQLLQNLSDGLKKYLDGEMTLEEIEDRLTSPVITDESDHNKLPENIKKIVFDLDMWEANNFSRDDIVKMQQELQSYIQTV